MRGGKKEKRGRKEQEEEEGIGAEEDGSKGVGRGRSVYTGMEREEELPSGSNYITKNTIACVQDMLHM